MASIGGTLVARPPAFNAYEFVVIASLRAKQLLSGSVPRIEGDHSASTMAQMEVAGGKVGRAAADETQPARQCLWQL
jgi:DNA-directed RNA polymerase subunit K/omega